MTTSAQLDFLLTAIVFCIALATSVFFADGRYGLQPDGARELNVARSLANGDGLVDRVVRESSGTPSPRPVVTKPPLFIMLLALSLKLGFDPKVAGWMISQGSFTFSAALLYALARFALPRFPAFLVGLLFSIQVSGLHWSIMLQEDMLFLVLVLTSLFLLVKFKQSETHLGNWPWFVLGTVVAATVLTRYLGIAIVIAVAVILVFDAARDRKKTAAVFCYVAGLAAVGLWPCVRFVILWNSGHQPSFYQGSGQTWFPVVAGLLSTFQRDFLGRLVVWMYNGTPVDWILMVIGVAVLGIIILAPIRHHVLAPLSTFVITYLVILVVRQASSGQVFFESRYAMPVEGLLVLFITWLIWKAISLWSAPIRIAFAATGIFALGIFVHGQLERYVEFKSFSKGRDSSREYCPSPATIAWVKQNVPAGSVIIGTQCCYQLLAETSAYYWLPIPPADEYNSSARFRERWREKDFLKASDLTGARWIVMLFGLNGDPLAAQPGYGPFVTDLIAGKETNSIKRVAGFKDGIVYTIVRTNLDRAITERPGA